MQPIATEKERGPLREWFESQEDRSERRKQIGAIAEACGVSETTVYAWTNGTKRVPAEHCQHVQSITGIPLHVIRPGVFPVPRDAKPATSMG